MVGGGENRLGKLAEYAPQQQSQFFRASDITEPIQLTIKSAEVQDIKGVNKVVLSFQETEKRLVLNKTNAKQLLASLGNVELSELVGHKITINSLAVEFRGQPTRGIRIVHVK